MLVSSLLGQLQSKIFLEADKLTYPRAVNLYVRFVVLWLAGKLGNQQKPVKTNHYHSNKSAVHAAIAVTIKN